MFMPALTIPSDAFSHGQIKSKLWLCENFSVWQKQYLNPDVQYTLHWYGSWVAVGPFLLLSSSPKLFNKINLYDLNAEDLKTSTSLLDYWKCESVAIQTFNVDVDYVQVSNDSSQVLINTSCEHIPGNAWLDKISPGSFVILQSTNMPHSEHINSPLDLQDFIQKYEFKLNILNSSEIDFNYPDKSFKRFMLFGTRK